MTFICICYESILFEPGKDIVNVRFLKFNSFSIILSANVRSGTIIAVQIVINIKQIRQENETGPNMNHKETTNNVNC